MDREEGPAKVLSAEVKVPKPIPPGHSALDPLTAVKTRDPTPAGECFADSLNVGWAAELTEVKTA